jgi:hypothetical protein
MKVLFSSTVFIFAIVPAAFAGFYASPAVVDVHVIGCQTYPLEGMRVMLVGEAVAEDLGEGRYRFEAVEPGEHRLLVYDEFGDVYDEPFVTTVPLASAELEIIICMCIETRMTRVKGTVRDVRGKVVKGAGVAVRDLFLDTATDSKGRYEFKLPPGTWEIAAWTDGGDEDEAFASVTLPGPEDPGEVMPVVDLDLTIE